MAIQYTTTSEMRSFASSLTETARVAIRKRAETRSPVAATFLSHSTKDGDIVPYAVNLLEAHGAAVYIDKKDAALPPYTSRETARILRDRIGQSSKFVLLASENSKGSRWVPWELGLADGHKSPRNVAIFPAVDQAYDYAWTEQEYLGIYDRIVFGDHSSHTDKIWMVLNQEKNTATELGQWLRS